jgi:hypothetical protein
MATQKGLNRDSLGGNFVMYQLMLDFVAAGWTLLGSGSGSEGVYSSGNVFNGVLVGDDHILPSEIPPNPPDSNTVGKGIGQEKFGNGSCWFWVADPKGRQWVFQKEALKWSSGDYRYGIWFSRAGLFTGGGAAVRPTTVDPADEFQINSLITPIWQQGGIASKTHIAVDVDPANASGEYGFFVADIIATNQEFSGLWLDPLQGLQATAQDAYVIHKHRGSAIWTPPQIGGDNYQWAPINWPGYGVQWQTVRYVFPAFAAQWYHSVGGQSLYDGGERPIPLFVADLAIAGQLGRSRWLYSPGVARGYPHTFNSKTGLYLDECLIRDLWDGVATPDTI